MPKSVLRIAITDMVALNVRIRERHRPKPPEFFYQILPPDGITLLATIPREVCAVAIPGKSSWRSSQPFVATLPEFAGGIVVVYKLQTDCRYSAVTVSENGYNYTFDEFIETVGRLTRERFGNLITIPGRYAYTNPCKEEWGTILRDDGYVAMDPEKFERHVRASGSLASSPPSKYAHVIRIRVPLYSGDKLPSRNPLPVFSRVEVFQGDGAQNRWLDFEEYTKERSESAIVPDAIVADFQEWLSRLTEESGFEKWRFRPGMIFGERTEWWGARGRRRTTHEGIDFVEGFRNGGVNLIPEGVPVRAVASGEIVAALDDFMGKTVVVRHTSPALPGGEVFHTLLSHIQTEGQIPSFVTKGEILGRVGRRASIRIHPHLHLTGAWYPVDFPFAEAGINTIMHPGFSPAILVNLNGLIETDCMCVISPDDEKFLIDE